MAISRADQLRLLNLPGVIEGLKKARGMQAAAGQTAMANRGAMSGDYGGYEQGGPGADPVNDPTGRGLVQRGMESFNRGQQAQREMTGFSGGVAPDPSIEGFLQAMHERGIRKLAGGPSAAGSSQIT